jgi:hypothetical protein
METDTMSTWLFNSRGHPVVFVDQGNVYTKSLKFVGRLDGNEVWNTQYVGEIVKDNRFLYNIRKGMKVKPTHGLPTLPKVPRLPTTTAPIAMPSGYKDVEIPA